MSQKANLPRKACVVCGRPMLWRRRWALTWQGVKYCSDRCRQLRRKPAPNPGAG